MIDEAALPLRRACAERLLDYAVEVSGGGRHRGSERPAAERAEAHALHLRHLARLQRQAVVVDDEELAVAHDRRALGGKVERHHVELLAGDIAPDVALGPIRQREY